MAEVRQATNRVLELIEEGGLDRHTVILACFKYMSEYDVQDMAENNGFIETDEFDEPEEEEEDEDVLDRFLGGDDDDE